MSGFAETVEIRAARPSWVRSAIAAGLLLAFVAVLIADLAGWMRMLLLGVVVLGAVREWRAASGNAVASGVAAVWLTGGGDWRLVLDTGELEKAELLHRQGFVTRKLVGLTLRRKGAGRRMGSRIRVWLTPGMLAPAEWRRLQVRLRNP